MYISHNLVIFVKDSFAYVFKISLNDNSVVIAENKINKKSRQMVKMKFVHIKIILGEIPLLWRSTPLPA